MFYLSGISPPYDPVKATGTLGRGAENGTPGGTSTSGTINIGANAYSAGNSGGGGYNMEDFADDNFDHKGLSFIGGGNIGVRAYLRSGPEAFSVLTSAP